MAPHPQYLSFDVILPSGQPSGGPFFGTICNYILWIQGNATGVRLLSQVDTLLRHENLSLRIEQVPQSREVFSFKMTGYTIGGHPWFRLRCANPPGQIVAPWHPPTLTRAIYFAHELIHVLRNLRHMHIPLRSEEEWATIGLGQYAANDFSENRIRCERGLPLRTSHYDYYAGHSAQDEINRFHDLGYADPICRNGRYEHPLVIQPRWTMTVPQERRR